MTVGVSVTCHAQVYDHEAVVRLVTNALMQQATTTLGTDYALRGTISTTITQAGAPPHAKPGTLTLLVTGQGAWVYQIRTAEQARLSRLIAGLSRQQAMHVLQQQELVILLVSTSRSPACGRMATGSQLTRRVSICWWRWERRKEDTSCSTTCTSSRSSTWPIARS